MKIFIGKSKNYNFLTFSSCEPERPRDAKGLATTAQRGGRSEKRRAEQCGFCRSQKWPADNKGEVTGVTADVLKRIQK